MVSAESRPRWRADQDRPAETGERSRTRPHSGDNEGIGGHGGDGSQRLPAAVERSLLATWRMSATGLVPVCRQHGKSGHIAAVETRVD